MGQKTYLFSPWRWGGRGGLTLMAAPDSAWEKPERWSDNAELDGTRATVMCDLYVASDDCTPKTWRVVEECWEHMFDLVESTPELDWVLVNVPSPLLQQAEDIWGASWPKNATIGLLAGQPCEICSYLGIPYRYLPGGAL